MTQRAELHRTACFWLADAPARGLMIAVTPNR